jgi:hypothetical protein
MLHKVVNPTIIRSWPRRPHNNCANTIRYCLLFSLFYNVIFKTLNITRCFACMGVVNEKKILQINFVRGIIYDENIHNTKINFVTWHFYRNFYICSISLNISLGSQNSGDRTRQSLCIRYQSTVIVDFTNTCIW